MPENTAKRHPCGSLRSHNQHHWTGQSYGEQFICPGNPPAPRSELR